MIDSTVSKYSYLPWNFEAFRLFLSYEVLKQAASTICLFDAEDIFTDPTKMENFQRTMAKRTGLDWAPNRTVSEDVLFDVEGNLFRNKARVLTSMFLVDPRVLKQQGEIRVTDFGRALGTGYVSREQFYGYIVSNFSYPHLAYEEGAKAWNEAGLTLKPLQFILSILLEMFRVDPSMCYVNANEFAFWAHGRPFMEKIPSIASDIIEARKASVAMVRERSDAIDRKINDIFGFLCLSGYTYYNGNNIVLNLVAVHGNEKAWYYEKRSGENRVDYFQQLLNAD